MIPILYERNEQHFNTRGLGELGNEIDSHVFQSANQEYELFLEYPAVDYIEGETDNRIWHELKVHERQILYKPSHDLDPHAFRIYDYDLDLERQTILVYARSRTYDIANIPMNNWNPPAVPSQIMSVFKGNMREPTDFDFFSDIETSGSRYEWEERNALSCIMGQEGSLISRWRGEVLRENRRISFLRRVGQDNVTTLLVGKNIEGIKVSGSTERMVTAIVPYARISYRDSNDENVSEKIQGDIVKSSRFDDYELPYYRFEDYSSELEEYETKSEAMSQLNSLAPSFFSEHSGIDVPELEIDVNMTDLAESEEYDEMLRKLDTVNVFDTVTARVPEWDIDIEIRVNALKYQGTLERNLEVQLGNSRESLFGGLTDPAIRDLRRAVDRAEESSVIAQRSSNEKSTNYHGTEDPNDINLIGQNGDIYFRRMGSGRKQMWEWVDDQWEMMFDTNDLETVKREVESVIEEQESMKEQAQKDLQTSLDNAQDLVDQSDEEWNRKFDDVEDELTVISDEADRANSRINEAIDSGGFSSLRDMTDSIIDIQETTSRIAGDAYERAMQAIQESSDNSDSISRIDADITRINGEINLRATKTEVDTIRGRVTDNEAAISIANSQILQRITRTELEGAIDDIEIGGRNLLTGTSSDWIKPDTFVLRNVTYEELGIEPGDTIMVGISFQAPDSVQSRLRLEQLNPSTGASTSTWAIYGSGKHRNTQSIRILEGYTNLRILVQVIGDLGDLEYKEIQVEKGNKVTPWQPAPEDLASQTQVNEIISTVDETTQTIARIRTDVDGKATVEQFNTISNTVSGNITRIGNAEGQLTQIESNVNGQQVIVERLDDDLGKLDTRMTTVADGFNVLSRQAIQNLVPVKTTGFLDFNDWEMGSEMSFMSNNDPGFVVRSQYNGSGLNTHNRVWLRPSVFFNGSTYTVNLLLNSEGAGAVTIGQAGNTTNNMYVELEPYVAKRVTFVYQDYNEAKFSIYFHRPSSYRIRSLVITEGGGASQAQLSVINNEINLRVKEDELLSQINAKAGRVLIRSGDNRLVVTPETTHIDNATIQSAHINNLNANKVVGNEAEFNTIRSGVLQANVVTSTHIQANNALIDKLFATSALIDQLTSKEAFISNIQAIDISANRITTGTLNASNVNIINMNANAISTGTITGANSYYNLSTGMLRTNRQGNQNIWTDMGDGRLWLSSDATGDIRQLRLDGQGLEYRTDNRIGRIRFNGQNFVFDNNLGMYGNHINSVEWLGLDGPSAVYTRHPDASGSMLVDGSRIALAYGPVSAPSDRLVITSTDVNIYRLLHMRGQAVVGADRFELQNSNFIMAHNIDPGTVLADGQAITLGIRDSTSGRAHSRIFRIAGRADFYRNVWMNGNTMYGEVGNESDRRLKTDIHDTQSNSLAVITELNFVDYKWINTDIHPSGQQFGLIAQDIDETLVLYEKEEDIYSININKLVLTTSHAVQQLNKKVDSNVTDIKALQKKIVEQSIQIQKLEQKLEGVA